MQVDLAQLCRIVRPHHLLRNIGRPRGLIQPACTVIYGDCTDSGRSSQTNSHEARTSLGIILEAPAVLGCLGAALLFLLYFVHEGESLIGF